MIRSRTLLIILLIAVLAAIIIGTGIYLAKRPLPTCAKIIAPDRPGVRSFLLTDPSAGALLGEHSALACPEAGGAYFEWYFLLLHTDQYYIEAALWLKGKDLNQGIAGFNIKDAVTLKPIVVGFEPGENPSFAKSGCDVKMMTRGPDGKMGESFIRLLKEGPNKGSFELRVTARKGELHLFLKPETPGMISDGLAADRTRPGSWYQFSAPVMMGSVKGEFLDHRQSGPPLKHEFPGPETKTANAYLEHLWGQADPDRFYWDWGEFEDPERGAALIYSQAERPNGDISAFFTLARQFDLPIKLIENPPEERVRVVYSRFFQEEGALYPQQIMIWALAKDRPESINLEGFIVDHDHDYLVFNLSGPVHHDIWRESRSTIQFFKGAMVRDRSPAPPRDFLNQCGDQGCKLSWKHPPCSEGQVEYWLFRESNGYYAPQVPLSSVSAPCQGTTAIELSYSDPMGRREDVYTLIPVSVPTTLLHQRLQAGYPVCPRPILSLVGATEPLPPSLFSALDQKNPKSFSGPEKTAAVLETTQGKKRVRLIKEQRSGAYKFVLEKIVGKDWAREVVLPLRFGPGVQIQSFDAEYMGPLVLVWSERSPIMGGNRYSNWQVFRALMDLTRGTFIISSLSKSELEAVEVNIYLDEKQNAKIKYRECNRESCEK